MTVIKAADLNGGKFDVAELKAAFESGSVTINVAPAEIQRSVVTRDINGVKVQGPAAILTL